MAGHQQKLDNLITDASGKGAGMTDDKFALYESSKTDSGFLSGGNLLLSGEIQSEELTSEENQPLTDSGVVDDSLKTNSSQPQDSYMRLDSGVELGLSESFSSLSLKHPGLNDLSSSKGIKDPISPVQQTKKQEEQPPWELYYEQDEDGDTQLHAAIVQGFLELVIALIRAAPHPRLLDTPNDDAQSPLHLAVMTGQWRIARWLIVAGARPCPRNLQGDSPLHICARMGDLQSCKAIADPVAKHERDALALSYPQQPYQPCDFDQWNYEGKTCVHVAAAYGHVDVLRHLVWYGADINAREGTSGYTALHYALQREDEKMAQFLLSEKQLNPNVLTYGRKSVLQLGFQVPSSLAEALRLRGVASPYSSDEEEYDEDSEDEFYENTNIFQTSIIHASA